MKHLTLTACSLFAIFSAYAQIPDTTKADVWGQAPPASDDRFSNPKSKLYAGPDGWFNTGEVRATVSNAARTAYKYAASFQLVSGDYAAVKGPLVLHMEFGTAARPKAGVYKVGAKGDAAQNMVHFSFADVSDNQIKEWSAQQGAGTLTISSVNGFTYFTCRNVVLQPTGMSNKGEMKNPMTLGFEGALPPE
jgi:hypothetical protein